MIPRRIIYGGPVQEVIMKRTRYWIFGICVCLSVFAANSNAADRFITADTVWATGTGPYTQTNLFIDATLTVQPGVVVQFNDGACSKYVPAAA